MGGEGTPLKFVYVDPPLEVDHRYICLKLIISSEMLLDFYLYYIKKLIGHVNIHQRPYLYEPICSLNNNTLMHFIFLCFEPKKYIKANSKKSVNFKKK